MSSIANIYNEISQVAQLLQNKGWAEKNAGNFSIRVKSELGNRIYNEIPLSTTYPKLSNLEFVVTGKGKRMRDIAVYPENNTVVLRINSMGDAYALLTDAIVPTSELTTHLGIHNMIAERGSCESAVVHSHVTELIALTHNESYCNEDNINKLLWKMHPETIMFLPKGIGFVPFEIPGSAKIAEATIEALNNHPIALWEKHGVFSIAPTLHDCYDLLDIVSKSARIYFLCAQTGILPQGISDHQLEELRKIEF